MNIRINVDVNVNAKSFTSFGLLHFVFRTSSSVSVLIRMHVHI